MKDQLTQLVPESETDGAIIVAAAGNGPPASKKAKGLGIRFWASACQELQHSLGYHLKRKFNKS